MIRGMVAKSLPGRFLCVLICGFIAGAASGAPLDTLAVLEFGASNASAADAAVISNLVRSAVVRTGRFIVVDRDNITRVLAEQSFQQTGCTTQACAVKLGRLLNARKIVVGEYAMLGGAPLLTAQLVDVESGRIETTAKEKGFEPRDADAAAERLAAQLMDARPASVWRSRPARWSVGIGYAHIAVDTRVRPQIVTATTGARYYRYGYASGYRIRDSTPGFAGSLAGRMPLGRGPWSVGLDLAAGGAVAGRSYTLDPATIWRVAPGIVEGDYVTTSVDLGPVRFVGAGAAVFLNLYRLLEVDWVELHAGASAVYVRQQVRSTTMDGVASGRRYEVTDLPTGDHTGWVARFGLDLEPFRPFVVSVETNVPVLGRESSDGTPGEYQLSLGRWFRPAVLVTVGTAFDL